MNGPSDNSRHNVIFVFMSQLIIRAGKREDLPHVLALVKELALFERSPEQVTNNVTMMEADGFGPNPVYGIFVAERGSQIVGISIYYYRYSTWKGKRLYLEDIIVTETERGSGIGKKLFERTMQKALEDNCTGMTWQVLDWNTPAIEFYKRFGANFDSAWVNCNLEADLIRKFVNP
jgi:GNAT superfamily N-acetyltransferase